LSTTECEGRTVQAPLKLVVTAMRRLWLSCHQPEDIRLTAIVEVRLSPNNLITYDLESVKHVKHLIATADEIGPAFHHHEFRRA
jgi:hypothetical protein